MFDCEGGLDGLLDNLLRDNVFVGLLHREKAYNRITGSDFRAELRNIITSSEFQEHIIPTILGAYSEKKRRFFVHLPKCAGSDLTSHLLGRFPDIDFRMAEHSSMAGNFFFREIRRVASLIERDDQVFIHGHLSLEWWLRQKLHRPQDAIFTVIRDPIDIALSKINYVLQRFEDDPNATWIDTREFQRLIGLSTIDKQYIETNKKTLCRDMLYNPNITHANSMCAYLGDGSFSSAVANIIAGDVEVATVDTYKQWTTERWNIEHHTRINASTRFLTRHDLDADDLAHIDRISTEDRKLFAHVQKRIRLTGQPSIQGRALGRGGLLKQRLYDKMAGIEVFHRH